MTTVQHLVGVFVGRQWQRVSAIIVFVWFLHQVVHQRALFATYWAVSFVVIQIKRRLSSTCHHQKKLSDKVRAEEGLVVAIEFTAFYVQSDSTCSSDYVTIKNDDGTTLMKKTCGFLSDDYDEDDYGIVIGGETGSSLPAALTSTSNKVEVYFHTDSGVSYSGWSLTWRAVTPGAWASLHQIVQ